MTVDDDSTFAHVIPLSGANGTVNFVVYNRNLQGQTPDNITINILAKVRKISLYMNVSINDIKKRD